MKKILAINLLCFFLFGCVGTKAFIAPGFTGQTLNAGGIAVLPALAGETGRGVPGIESYCRTVGEQMAVGIREKQPTLKVIGPSEVSSIFGKEGFVKDYAQIMENYKMVGMLDTSTAIKLATPLGVKHLLLTRIQSLYAEKQDAVAVLSTQVWSVDRAEMVFESSRKYTAYSVFGLTGPDYQRALKMAGDGIIGDLSAIYGSSDGSFNQLTAIPKEEKAKEIEAPSTLAKNEIKVTEPHKIAESSNQAKHPKLSLKVIKSGNIRSTPSTSSKIIAKVKKGEMIQGQGKSGDWYIITLPSGEGGWVFKGLVKVID